VKSVIFENPVVGRLECRERKNILENLSDIESTHSNDFFFRSAHPVGSFGGLKTVLELVCRTSSSTVTRYPLDETYYV
jgi:hypothetical protein